MELRVHNHRRQNTNTELGEHLTEATKLHNANFDSTKQ